MFMLQTYARRGLTLILVASYGTTVISPAMPVKAAVECKVQR